MRILPRVLSLGLAFLGGISGASAGTVNVEQTDARRITVVAEGASVSEVVGKLGETYGFRLDHKGGAKPADPARDDQSGLDGRYEGSLRTVLERILDKESYFIEHAPQSKSGIARVVLYNIGAPQAAVQPAGGRAASPAPAAPVPVAAVPRYVPPAPATPALVPPVRRVQPVTPAVPARSNAAAPSGQTSVGVAGQPAPAAGAAAPQARKRGGVIQ